MPLEEPRLVLTRQWLAKATQDLGLAEHAVEDTPFLGGAVFHCQQAAEKALKAFLTWRGQPFRKTHQLVELVQACADLDAAFASLSDAAATLTPYAWEYRYPGDFSEPTTDEAHEAARLARTVLDFVLQRLPDEARP